LLIFLVFSLDDEVIFGGQLGLDLPPELGQPTPCSDGPICWHWGSAAKLYIDQTSGVNFIYILCTAFALVDPESVKNTVKSSVSFYAFGIYKRIKVFVKR
jgi:hypothetical protein